MYVDQNKIYGIWFDGGYGAAAAWVLGLISGLAEGKRTYGFAMSNVDTFCPSLIKEWEELFDRQWTYSTKAIVKCSSGDKRLLIKA